MKKSSLFLKIVFILAVIACTGVLFAACNTEADGGKCSITFFDGDNVLETRTFKQGEIPSYTPQAPEGKVFGGWFTDTGLTKPVGVADLNADSLNLYVKWDTATYTVVFFDRGTVVKVDGQDTQTVEYGGAAVAPTDPETYGYIFQGWDKSYVNVKQNLSVNAVYIPITGVITFKFGDITLFSDSCNFGEELAAMASAAKTAAMGKIPEGFTFGGWYSDKELKNKVDLTDATMDAKDTTYYAKDVIAPMDGLSIKSDLASSSGNQAVYSENLSILLSVNAFYVDQIVYSYEWFKTGIDGNEICGTADTLTLNALDAGTHMYTLSVKAQSEGYDAVYASAEITIKILPADIAQNEITVLGYYGVYDGNIYSLSVSGAKPSDTLSYKTDDGQFVTALAIRNAGKYRAYVKISRKNYNDLILSADIEIEKRDIHVTVEPVSATYGDNVPEFKLSIYESSFGEADGWSDFGTPTFVHSYSKGSPAAEYSVTPAGLLNANYNVSYLSSVFMVLPAVLRVSPNAATILYGDALPVFNPVYSGFVNGEDQTIVNGSVSFKCDYALGNDSGSYPVEFLSKTLGAPNYIIEYTDGNLIVSKRPLTVTADNASVEYGENAPEFHANVVNAFVAGDADLLASLVKFSCEYDSDKHVGEFTLTPYGLTHRNYTFDYVEGILTVYKREITVTPATAQVAYGSSVEPDKLTYVIDRPVGGDDLGKGSYVYSNYTQGSPVLSAGYELNVTLAANANYAITYEPGVLNVVPRKVNVAIKTPTVIYGANKIDFDFECDGLYGDDVLLPSYHCDYVTGNSAGSTFKISATFNNPNYNAQITEASFTVQKAPLTVSVTSSKTIYGITPVFRADYSGFVNNENQSNLGGKLSFGCDYPSNKKAGAHDVVPSGYVSNNYEITYKSGTLTVEKAVLRVTAPDSSVIYGDAASNFEVSIAGFVFDEDASVLSGAPIFVCPTYSAGTPAGTIHAADISGYQSDNYTFEYSGFTFNVTKRPITLNVNKLVTSDGISKWSKSDWSDAKGLFGSDTITGTLSTNSAAIGVYRDDSGRLGAFEWQNFALSNGNEDVSSCYIITYDLYVEILDSQYIYSADGVNTVYDGKSHSVSVTPGNADWKVEYSTDNGVTYNSVNPGYKNAGTYTVRFRILSPGGDSIAENNLQIVIAKKTLTVSAKDLSVTYGVATPNFTANFSGMAEGDENSFTGTLKLESNYSAASAATRKVGTYDIIPSGIENGNYTIVFVNGTLTVTRKTLNVTANDAETTYGMHAPTLIAGFNGLEFGDTERDLGTLAMTCEYAVGNDAGAYAISLSGLNSDNYNIVYTNGELVVKKAELVVTALDRSTVYGQNAPDFNAIYQGFVNGENETVLDGALTLTSSYSAGSHVNEAGYAITATGLTSKNYNITYVNGKLSVSPAPVTITLGNAQITYGESAPSFELTYSGLFNDDTLNGNLVFSHSYTPGKGVGNYTVVPSGLSSANYVITFVEGTLNVVKRNVSVAVNDLNLQFGSNAVYGFTVTNLYSGDTNDVLGTPVYTCGYTPGASSGSTFEIAISGLSNPNYDIVVANGVLSVTQRSVEVEWTKNQSYVYTGSDQSASVSARYKDVNGEYVSIPVAFDKAFKNAGTYSLSASTKDGNYTLTNAGVTIVIDKAKHADITHRALTGTYDHATNLSSYALDEYFRWASSEVPVCGITQYKAYYNTDAENYYDFELNVTLVLEKATVSVSNSVYQAQFTGGPLSYSPILSYNGSDLNPAYYTPIYANNANTQTNGGTYRISLTIESDNYRLPATDCYFKIATVLFNGAYYTIEDALKAASSGTVVVKNDTAFADSNNNGCYVGSEYYTVKAGVQLLVPYEVNDKDATDELDTASDAVPTGAFCTLTLPGSITLTIRGTLNVNAIRGKNGTPYMGHTIGAYGSMIVETNAKIIAESGAVINSNGFITGDGEIEAQSGSTVYEVLSVRDFRGGKVTTSIYKKYFPFNQYAFDNIEVTTKYYSGSKMYGRYFLKTSVANANGTMLIVGSDTIFDVASGYIEKSYDKATAKCTLSLNGNMKTNNVTIKVSSITMSTEGLDFPISGNFILKMQSGSVADIDTKFKMLPGSALIVEDGATVNINNGGSVYFFGNGEVFSNGIYTGIANYPAYGGGATTASSKNNVVSYNLSDNTLCQIDGTLNVASGGAFGGLISSSASGKAILNGTLNGTLKGNLNVTDISGLLSVKYTLDDITITAKANTAGGIADLEQGVYNCANGVWTKA